MNRKRSVEGRWWLHGDSSPPYFGTLTFDPESGSKLTAKVPQNRSPTDLMFEDLIRNQDEVKSFPQIIHGADENNHAITIFGCGSYSKSTAAGLDTYDIGNIGAVMLNHRGKALDADEFQTCRVNYTLLTEWMDRRLTLDSTINDGVVTLKFKGFEHPEYRIGSDLIIRFDGSTHHGSYPNDIQLGWRHRVWLVFSRAKSVKEIYDNYATVLLRMLSLLAGERVFIEECAFYNRDPFLPSGGEPLNECELLVLNTGVSAAKRDIQAPFMIAAFPEIESDFAGIVERWLECHDRLEPVLDLYSTVIANGAPTAESRFLFLSQALEVFHARSDRYAKKEKFKQRIDNIIETDKLEAQRITSGIKDFANKVSVTRNYYTHYDAKWLATGKVLKGLELRAAIFALEDLLHICLLKELGIHGSAIERIINRNGRSSI